MSAASFSRWRSGLTVTASIIQTYKDQGNDPQIVGCSASHAKCQRRTRGGLLRADLNLLPYTIRESHAIDASIPAKIAPHNHSDIDIVQILSHDLVRQRGRENAVPIDYRGA